VRPVFVAVIAASWLSCTSKSSDPAPDAAAPVVDSGSSATSCSAALEETLKPVDRVAASEVTVLSDEGGVRRLFIDATAGGPAKSTTSPFIYVNLERGQRVDVTDVSARTSTDWDLALKRQVIFTNGGDGGSGQGATALSPKMFAEANADGADFAAEKFFDADCNVSTDPIGAVKTSFSSWYDYELGSNHLTPRSGTYLVQGGSGKRYKLAIETYYGLLDGGTGAAGALYVVTVASL
jgi:hypothetical protein